MPTFPFPAALPAAEFVPNAGGFPPTRLGLGSAMLVELSAPGGGGGEAGPGALAEWAMVELQGELKIKARQGLPHLGRQEAGSQPGLEFGVLELLEVRARGRERERGGGRPDAPPPSPPSTLNRPPPTAHPPRAPPPTDGAGRPARRAGPRRRW